MYFRDVYRLVSGFFALMAHALLIYCTSKLPVHSVYVCLIESNIVFVFPVNSFATRLSFWSSQPAISIGSTSESGVVTAPDCFLVFFFYIRSDYNGISSSARPIVTKFLSMCRCHSALSLSCDVLGLTFGPPPNSASPNSSESHVRSIGLLS